MKNKNKVKELPIAGLDKSIAKSSPTQELLKEAEEKYKILVENSTDIIYRVDNKGNILFANKAFREILGYLAKEIKKINGWGLVHPHDLDRVKEQYAQIVQGKATPMTFRYKTKDGTYLVLQSNITPIFNNGKLIGNLGISRDVTSLRNAEEEVRQARDDYLSITNLTGDIIVRVDENGRWTFLNDYACKFWGKPRNKLLGKKYADYLYPDDAEKTNAAVQERIKTKKIVRGLINRQKTPSGWRTVEWNGSLVFNEDGVFVGFQATGRDITEKREMEEALKESEEKFRIFFEYAPDYCYMISPQGKILAVNRSAIKVLGYKKSELFGKYLKTIYASESLPKAKKLLAKWERTGKLKDEELIISTKNGERRNVLLSAEAIRGKDGKILHSISIQKDITERKRIEAELEHSHKRLRGLSAHLQDLREDDRKHIAHAIHDDLGQLLTVLSIDLARLWQKIPANLQHLKEKAKSLREVVDKCFETVQRISTELRPIILDDVGLIPALEWQVQEFQNLTGIKCNTNINTNGIIPDTERSVVIFRILQETLTNIARHAKATKVRVGLKANLRKITLKIKDNGKGITHKQITGPDSFGLLGMQESVLPWGGKLDIEGIKDKGTTIKASLPIK